MSHASPQTSPSHAVTIRGIVRAAVERAWDRAVASGALPAMPADADRPAVEVERPADPVHGDFATNLAMKLARPYRMAPLAIAAALAAELTAEAADDPASPIAAAEVAAPGFLNLRLRDDALEATVAAILADPASWGRTAAEGTGRSVNVEFVSANPTGPLHVGNARGAFVGDLLCRVLEAGGQRVTREYYFNDSGGQVAQPRRVGRGAPARRAGPGGRLPRRLRRRPRGGRSRTTSGRRPTARRRRHGRRSSGAGRPAASARASRPASSGLGVRFDVWTSEALAPRRGLGRAGGRAAARARPRLRAGRRAVVPLDRRSATTRTGSSIRSNGEPTYFAADIGYVTEKFSRGFDHLIYIWGADHHGTVARVRNAAEAMGYDRDAVQILLYRVGPLRARRRGGLDEQAGRRVHHPRRAAGRGRRRRRALVLRVTRGDDRHRLRHRAGQEAVDREPRLLRPVRARPDRVDPAQGGRRRAWRRRPTSTGALAGAPEAALARAIARFPEVVEDAVAAEETQGDHRLRDRARDDVPRASTATRGSSTPTSRSARRRASRSPSAARITLANALGAARDLRARVDVARAGRSLSRRGPSAPATLPDVVASLAMSDPARRAAGAGQDLARRPAAFSSAVVAAVSNAAASASVSQAVCMADGPRAVRALDDREPVAAPAGGRGVARRPAATPARAARSQLELAERVLERDRPAGPEPRREVRRQRRPRPAPRRPRTCRGGGSARSTPASSRRGRRRPASRRRPARPGRSRSRSCTGRSACRSRIAGVRSSTAWLLGVVARREDLEELGLGQVAPPPTGSSAGSRRPRRSPGGRGAGRSGRARRPGP